MYGMQCNDIVSNIVLIRMFFTLFSNRTISFFTLQSELFTSCNVSNNASLVSARTVGGSVVNHMWTGLVRGRVVPKIPKFVRTSFMDDTQVLIFDQQIMEKLLQTYKKIDKGPLRHDITAEMPIETAPHPYVNVSHFLLYPFPLCHQTNSGKRLPWSKTLKNNFT